jgi:hypothetical protein
MYSGAAWERAMKIEEIILKGVCEEDHMDRGGRYFGDELPAYEEGEEDL